MNREKYFEKEINDQIAIGKDQKVVATEVTNHVTTILLNDFNDADNKKRLSNLNMTILLYRIFIHLIQKRMTIVIQFTCWEWSFVS